MINVELSSIWSCVSLPQLLSCEKDLFDAHLHLRSNQPNAPEFLGWLGQPDALTAKTVHAIRKACETISGQCDTLVVAGAGEGYLAAKAGIEAIGGRYRNLLDSRMRILFTGDSMASSDWIAHDFCLLLLSSEGVELEMCAASRALRWLMERRYGQSAKERVYVSAKQGSGLAVMAKEEGFTFLPMDGCLGGGASALNAGTLLVMAAAGIDPLGVLEGAAEGFSQYDLRAFENPVWMYAGARYALLQKGRCFQKVNIEMDWKDYDGLGFLAGKTLLDAQEASFQAVLQAHTDLDVPVIQVSMQTLDAAGLGELFYFFELSGALSACACGIEAFDVDRKSASRMLTKTMLGG